MRKELCVDIKFRVWALYFNIKERVYMKIMEGIDSTKEFEE